MTATRIEFSLRVRKQLSELEEVKNARIRQVSAPIVGEQLGIVRGFLEGKDLDTALTDFHVADDFSHAMVVPKSGVEQGQEGASAESASTAPENGVEKVEKPGSDPALREAIAAEARAN